LEKEEFEDWAEVLAKAKQQSGIGCEEAEMRHAYRQVERGKMAENAVIQLFPDLGDSPRAGAWTS
jgi:hypothetical protein